MSIGSKATTKNANFTNSGYRKIASSNTSRLEAQKGFFRLLMKRIFGPYVHLLTKS